MQAIEIPPVHREAVYKSAIGLIACAADDVADAARTESESLPEAGKTLAAFTSLRDWAFRTLGLREDVPASIEGEPRYLRALLCDVVTGQANSLDGEAQSELGYMDDPDSGAIETIGAMAERIHWASSELASLDREPLAAVA